VYDLGQQMNETLLWLILLGSAVTAVLALVLLIRLSKISQGGGREVRDELRMGREETRSMAKELREEVSTGQSLTSDTLSRTLESLSKVQQSQLEGMTRQLKELTDSNQNALERVRTTFDARVKELQEGNEKKLDEMRKTVDEKLHDTLEKRLGESFKLVSDRLEAVHKGLGEMQLLATGVGDLKRVLTNVKARGTWAEVQLGAILEQILTLEQYAKNVQVKADAAERVEYAVRLPGSKDDPGACVWLPIDSKFPQEDYLRLQEAADRADLDAIQKAADDLGRTVRGAAKDIHDKYVNPPTTTDFGIMFLATEGLYAEVLRQPALVEDLQQRYRVVVAGPTTLAAILNSLRMGFQTLVIEKRAAEVWRVLGAIKTEFGKFGDVLEKVKRQLNTASRTIEETGVRSRAMEKKLRSVEQLPEAEASAILALPAAGNEVAGEDMEVEEPTREATREREDLTL
jgi:DNA recombination protein RmuC